MGSEGDYSCIKQSEKECLFMTAISQELDTIKFN
jgi:hypothetical protein